MAIHSAFQYSYLWLPLIGLIVGLLATMVGGSGGSVFPPILILLFQVPPHIAVATSLAATLPICLVGTIGHHRKGNIEFRTGLVFILSGFTGAVIGAYVTRLLDPPLFKIVLGIYFILLGLFLLYSTSGSQENRKILRVSATKWPTGRGITASAFGFMAGSATGLFGTSGTAPVLAGMFSLRLPLKVMAGTSLLVIFANTVSGLTGHLFVGQVDMTLVYLLASGSVFGSVAGPLLLGAINLDKLDGYVKKPRVAFRYGLTGFFLFIGILMMLN